MTMLPNPSDPVQLCLLRAAEMVLTALAPSDRIHLRHRPSLRDGSAGAEQPGRDKASGRTGYEPPECGQSAGA